MEEYSKLCPKCNQNQFYSEKYTLKIAVQENKLCNKCRGKERRIDTSLDGWNKNCPLCNEIQYYSCKSSLTDAIKKNKMCIKCLNKSKRKHNGTFQRICTCGKILKYSCRQSLNIAKNHNSICRNCATKESAKYVDRSFQQTEEYRKKQSHSHKGKIVSEITKEKISLASKKQWKNNREKMLAIITSDEYRLKQSLSNKKKWANKEFQNRMNVVHQSDDYKQKRREITLNIVRCKTNGKLSSYNLKACEFIDKLNQKNNWNLKHALNNNLEEYEVAGFLLDGFDKEKNIVFEYDEPHHYDVLGNLKSDDLYRQQKIIEKLNPKEFWRYDEKKKDLYEITSVRRVQCLLL